MSGRVVTLGEALGVLRADGGESFVRAVQAIVGTGGAEANVAIGLARLGVPVTWIGRVGADTLGQRIVRELRGEGVTVAVSVESGARTGLLLKESWGGRTRVGSYRAGSAGSHLGPDDVDAVALDDVRVLHLTGITPALSPTAKAAVLRAVGRAEAAGIAVSLDVNYRASLWSRAEAAAVLRPLAERCAVVFASLDEAPILLGATPRSAEDAARRLRLLGPAQAVVTSGEHGAVAATAGGVEARAAVPVDAVDTVGAGDAFVAGYLAEWLAGGSIASRLFTGARLGAAACRHPGDWEGVPTRDELGPSGADPVLR